MTAEPLAPGTVLKYSWGKFKANPVVWIIGVLVLLIIASVVRSIFSGFGAMTDDRFGGLFAVSSIIGTLVSAVVSYFVAAAITNAALEETSGTKATFQSFWRFQGVDIGQLLLASVLVGLATGIGLVLCVLPGIAVAFASCFVLPFILEGKQDAVTAIKSSLNLWSKNFGLLIVPAIVVMLLVFAGFVACFVGSLITIPMAYIAISYAYRVLTSKQIG